MNNRAKRKEKKIIFYLIVTVIAVIAMIPFLWSILLSFKSNSEIVNNPFSLPGIFSFENYRRALQTLNLPKMYGNTLLLVTISTFFSVILTFMSSFSIARMNFKNEKLPDLLYLFLLLGLAVPIYILLFPIYRIDSKIGIMGTYLGLILPYIAVNISFNTLLFVGFLRGFPTELEEAAIIDGCNIFELCIRVVMPVVKPTFITVVIFNAIYIFNEYPFASTFITNTDMNTISLMANMFKGQYSMDYSGIIAASIMIIIPELIFYAIFQKYIISGMTEGAVKG
ncbi:carbohydrate ABC transporter permease [Lachnospiraceae bacterium ZAX-1]